MNTFTEKNNNTLDSITLELSDIIKDLDSLNSDNKKNIEDRLNNLKVKSLKIQQNTEEETRNKLEKEFKKAQEKLNKLKNQEINNSLNEDKNKTNALSKDIETTRYNGPLTTYNELIKLDDKEDYGENPLHQRLLTVMSSEQFSQHPDLKDKTPEQRVEYFFKKINIALTKFYENKLISKQGGEVPAHINKVLVPATEIYLLNFLKNNQHENNVGVLKMAGELNRDDLNQLVDGITGIYNKYNYSYSSMKSLLNIADFLSLPQHQHYLKKLDNPYLLYQKVFVEKADLWAQKEQNIHALSLKEAGLGFLLDQDNDGDQTTNSDSIKKQIKQEIQSIEMVENPNTALKILGLINQVNKIFIQSNKISYELLNQINHLNGIDKVLRNYLGFNIFEEIKKSKWMSDIFNFALSVLGFSGGIKGLEAKWKRGNIENHLTSERREYISNAYKDYCDNKAKAETTRENGAIISQLELYNVPQNMLEKLKKKENQTLNKLDLDHTQLKYSMIKQLDNTRLIHIEALSALSNPNINFKGSNYLQTVVDANGKKILQLDQNAINADPNFKEKFVDTYLSTTINHIIKDDKYLEKINNSDDLAFTLISGVVIGEDNIIEGVKANGIFPSEFYDKPYLNSAINKHLTKIEPNSEIDPEWNKIKDKKLNNLNYDEAVVVLKSIFGEGPGTDLLVTLSEGEVCFITRIIALAQHEGKFVFGTKNSDPNKASQQINIGTFQISETKGKIVEKWNKSLKKGFEKIKILGIDYEKYGYNNADFVGIDTYNKPTSNDHKKHPQLDIIAWIGYIHAYRLKTYPDIFNKLRNPYINSDEVETLLHKTIQVGTSSIGKEVTKNLHSTSQTLVSTSGMEKVNKDRLLV